MTSPTASAELTLSDVLRALLAQWWITPLLPFVAAAVAIGVSYLVKPSFTGRVSFIPPQSQQNNAAGALDFAGRTGWALRRRAIPAISTWLCPEQQRGRPHG